MRKSFKANPMLSKNYETTNVVDVFVVKSSRTHHKLEVKKIARIYKHKNITI